MNIQDVEIFSAGVHAGDRFTEDDFDGMVSAFQTLGTVPLKLSDDEAEKWFGQRKGAPALGWVKSLRRVGSKLLADFSDIPARIGGLIQERKYRKTIETAWGHRDHAGRIWPRVLRGVVFSGLSAHLPRIEDLQDLQAALMSDTGRDLRAYYEAGEIRTYETEGVKKMSGNVHHFSIAGKPAWRIYDGQTYFDIIRETSEALAREGQEGFIGEFLFPLVRGESWAGRVPIFGRGEGRVEDVERSPGTASPRVGIGVSSVYVLAAGRGLRKAISVELEHNSGEAWRLRESTAFHLEYLLRLAGEQRAVNVVGSTSNVTTAFKPSSGWNGATAGNAVANVEHLIDFVSSGTGIRPDRIAFGATAWKQFTANTCALARCGGWVTQARVAETFRVSSVGICDARHNIGTGSDRKYTSFLDDVVVVFKGGGPEYSPKWGGLVSWRPSALDGVEGLGRFLVELRQAEGMNHSTDVEVFAWETEKVFDSSLAATLIGVGSAQAGGI